MKMVPPNHWIASIAAWVVLIAAWTSPVSAETAPNYEELLRRLEAAERQINELKSELSKQKRPTEDESSDSSDPRVKEEPSVVAAAASEVQPPEPPAAPAAVTGEASDIKKLDDRISALQSEWEEQKAAAAATKASLLDSFSVATHGYFKLDSLFFSQNTENVQQVGGVSEDSTGFRQARILLQGTGWQVFEYNFEVDFAGSQVALRDVWAGIKSVPIFDEITFGHKKVPFSLEELTSDKWITFMEPSLPNVFAPQRKTGLFIMSQNDARSLVWQYGIYQGGSDDNFGGGVQSNADAAFASRAVWIPWYDETTKRGLLHIGVDYGISDPFDDTVAYNTRGELVTAPNPNLQFGTVPLPNQLATGNILANVVSLYCTELAFVAGPFSIQNEFMVSQVQQRFDRGTLTFWGSYVEVAYFLTGESRATTYNRDYAWFDRIIPFETAYFVKDKNRCTRIGWGAWEVAGRWSYLDLEDGNISYAAGNLGAGTMTDLTLGINWYMTPGVRFDVNWVHSFVSRAGLNGDQDAVGLRAQYVW